MLAHQAEWATTGPHKVHDFDDEDPTFIHNHGPLSHSESAVRSVCHEVSSPALGPQLLSSKVSNMLWNKTWHWLTELWLTEQLEWVTEGRRVEVHNREGWCFCLTKQDQLVDCSTGLVPSAFTVAVNQSMDKHDFTLRRELFKQTSYGCWMLQVSVPIPECDT